MSVVVFGVSKLSFFLAKKLMYENEVTIVAMDGQNVGKFEDLGANVIFVSSVDPRSISALAIHRDDICISLFEADELNMVVCQLIGEIFGAKIRMAKVKNEFYLYDKGFIRNKKDGFMSLVGKSISLEEEVANSLVDSLQIARGMDFNCVMGGRFILTGINVQRKIDNLVNRLKSSGCAVLGVLRSSEFIPENKLDDVFPNDTVYIVVKKEEINDIMGGVFDLYFKIGNKNAAIIGGGNLGFAIAKKLKDRNLFKNIKIIEKDLKRATLLFENVEGIEIINGDILDQGVIMDANMQEADLIVSATENDSVNVISSHMCKRLGCKCMISILREDAFVGILRSFGADLIVNSFDIFASKIVNLLRADNDIKTSFFADCKNVLVEVEVKRDSSLMGMKVVAVEDRHNVTVAVVRGKNGSMHPPMQSYKICLGDVLLISMPYSKISQMKKVF